MLFLFIAFAPAKAVRAQYPEPASQDVSEFGAGVSRTFYLLASSTPTHRNKVNILVYGQSISRQNWWLDVKKDLLTRFPYADINMVNLAVGGFAIPALSDPAEQDIYPAYPDLILFHVYGAEPGYEALIKKIRLLTTAEIAIQSDHVTPGDWTWTDQHSFVWLPDLCRRYGLEMMEIRRPWYKYLKANKLSPSALLLDGVHLNPQGSHLMGALISRHMRYDPALPPDPYGMVRDYRVGGSAARWVNGKITLSFDGNRVDLIAGRPGPGDRAKSATIRIDGKLPSQWPECMSFTRPNEEVPNKDWPWDVGALVRVDHNAPLQEEDWTATITGIDATASSFTFDLSGTKTGPDGGGSSAKPFVSRSGRVVIQPGYWFINQAHDAGRVPISAGFQVKWRARLNGADLYTAPAIMDGTREYAATIVLGLPNEHHTLEIAANQPGTLPINLIRVYRPIRPEGAFRFNARAYTAPAIGGACITVDRIGGAAGPVSVSYGTRAGLGRAAAAGLDYTKTSGVLRWADGDSAPKTFTIPILRRGAADKNVLVVLSDPTGGARLGSQTAAPLRLTPASPPMAPTRLITGAGDHQITLSWTPGNGAKRYWVYRGTASGALDTRPIAETAAPRFTDTGLTNGHTYYYRVSSANSLGASGKSAESPETPQDRVIGGVQINCGGPAAFPFAADMDYQGGSVVSNYSGLADLSAAAGPAPTALYQTERLGNMAYEIPGLSPGVAYTVRLHFTEDFFDKPGTRAFNVSINGAPVLTNFDILATAGGLHKVTIQQYTTTAGNDGHITIQFTGVRHNAKIDGIEVIPNRDGKR